MAKSSATLPEALKLEFLKEIGLAHKRALEGADTLLQLSGLLARMCRTAQSAAA